MKLDELMKYLIWVVFFAIAVIGIFNLLKFLGVIG